MIFVINIRLLNKSKVNFVKKRLLPNQRKVGQNTQSNIFIDNNLLLNTIGLGNFHPS